MIGVFVSLLRQRSQDVRLLAPTGRAARVLTSKAGYPASTIHKAIYNLDELKEHDKQEARFKFYFELNKQSTDDLNKVFIVDEASLVSDRSSEQEFLRFGSGKLLSDLMENLRLDDSTQPSKLVFVGDPAQLPPVNDSISPALDASYLFEKHALGSQVIELTQVVRQKGESAILGAATRIREGIISGRQNACVIDPVPGQIEAVSSLDVTRRATEYNAEGLLGRYVIITYANATALRYNQMVRKAVFGCGETEAPRKNDIFMVTQNNKHHDVLNGDMVLVESADSNVEIRTAPVGKESIELTFRTVTIRIPLDKGGYRQEDCRILENVLYNKLRDITPEEQKALYVDFCIRKKDLKPGSADFMEAILDDPYFNALRVKFGYAITCHKAQGGEWEEVAVVFEQNRTDTDALRWVYTAITRAQKKLYGVNLPSFQPWGNVLPDSSPSNETPIPVTTESVDTLEEPKEQEDPFEVPFLSEFPEQPDFLRKKHTAVIQDFAEQHIKVDAVEVRAAQYFFRYTLSRDTGKARVQVYFNRKGGFRVQNLPEVEEDEELVKSASEILGRPVTVKALSGEKGQLKFPEDRPFLEEFYLQGVQPLLQQHNIQVIKVEHGNYRERYWFQNETGVAVVDYVYNKKGIFTHLDVISSKTTSETLSELFGLKGAEWKS